MSSPSPAIPASDLGTPPSRDSSLAGADQCSQLISSSSPARAPVNSSSSSKQAYTTEIVKALFGGAVGEVILDCSCSFQRQAGRLYIANKGLYFYSNLFGFEKKIRINYDQVFM